MILLRVWLTLEFNPEILAQKSVREGMREEKRVGGGKKTWDYGDKSSWSRKMVKWP